LEILWSKIRIVNGDIGGRLSEAPEMFSQKAEYRAFWQKTFLRCAP
jgi:hypothetical protein